MNTPQATPPPADTPPVSAPPPARLVAVIDIGATAIRMEIAEIKPDNSIRTLESARQPVELGKDTFTRGAIRQSNINRCVEILKGFKRIMDEYGIKNPDQIAAVATSSVREAENRDTALNRIYIATQINVRAIDEAEESRLTYMAAQSVMANEPDLKDHDILVVDAGGGSTELLLVQNGFVSFADSYRLGSLRMRETLETQRVPAEKTRALLNQHIHRTIEQIKRNVPACRPSILIAMSGDSRFAAAQLAPNWQHSETGRVDLKTFSAFTDKLIPLTVEKIVSKYKMTFPEAETVGPALLIYAQLAKTFKIDTLLIPKASLRDGLLKEMALLGSWTSSFHQQVIQSALVLGLKYGVDEQHARHVTDLALRLFDELKTEHQLAPRHRLLLEAAGLLHEAGGYVSSRSHHKHSFYLILNSDLFGLTKADMKLIALVARYHRRAIPSPLHPDYTALDRESQIIVSKLAALLRVADALDRNHSQKLKDFTIAREGDRFLMTIQNVEDLTLERLAIKEKGNLFEDIYGMPIILQEARVDLEQDSHGS